MTAGLDHALVIAVPVDYPRAVSLEYRVVDAVTEAETGQVVTVPARPWHEIRHSLFLRPDEAAGLELQLARGSRAEIGIWKVRIDTV